MTIEGNSVLELVRGEIMRVAASAYTEDGTSMYDAIRPISRDEEQLLSYYDKALSYMNARFKGRAIHSGTTLSLPLQDSVASEDVIQPMVTTYLVNRTCAEWFRKKYPAKYEEYATEATSILDQIVVLVKTRKEPTKGGIKL
jgi:hypothetical protein